MFSKKPAEQGRPAPPPRATSNGMAGNSTFSVIGPDVTIRGDISASADLHVDGTVEGDIKCASLVQGETSEVHGGVMAESARLAGKVVGSITARELVILKSARIEGDVHYDALTIEQGAEVDGRFSPNSQRQATHAAPEDGDAEDADEATLQLAN